MGGSTRLTLVPTLEAVAEEPAPRPRMRVVVVGDVAHVVVDVVLELEVLRHDRGKPVVKGGLDVIGWRRVVLAPHDHRHGAQLA